MINNLFLEVIRRSYIMKITAQHHHYADGEEINTKLPWFTWHEKVFSRIEPKSKINTIKLDIEKGSCGIGVPPTTTTTTKHTRTHTFTQINAVITHWFWNYVHNKVVVVEGKVQNGPKKWTITQENTHLACKIKNKLIKSIKNKYIKYWGSSFFTCCRLKVHWQRRIFRVIIGCRSALPSPDCTFCFQKHPLISFCQQRNSVEHSSIVPCFAFLQNRRTVRY